MNNAGWLAVAALAALPLLADLFRGECERCAVDGVTVNVSYRVRIVDSAGASHTFCGVRCAARWLSRSDTAARSILVTDLTRGTELDGNEAWFVRTSGTWGEDAPDAIRVFATEEAARKHADAYAGAIMDRPFGGLDENR